MQRTITSVSNQRITRAVKLRRGRHRRKSGLIIIDGVREIKRAADAGIEFTELFANQRVLNSEQIHDIIAQVENLGAEVHAVSSTVLQKLQFGDRNEGIVAVARPPAHQIGDLQLSSRPLIMLLEAVEKPGNVGAIVRSADAAGFDALLVIEGGTDLFNPNSVRASSGAIFSFPVATASTQEAVIWLTEIEAQILVARADATTAYTDVDYQGASAIVVGNEAHGISDQWPGPIATPIRIPMHGTGDSLNVSTAAAVLMFEARRQRMAGGVEEDSE